jgi:hypothetical protein
MGEYDDYSYYYNPYEYPYCFGNLAEGFGSATVTVGQPDHVSVVTDNLGYPKACPTTGVYLRQMQMQVVDVGGNAITTDTYIQETFSNLTTNTCGSG